MVCSGTCEGCACPRPDDNVDDIESLPRMQKQLQAANERASKLEALLAEALAGRAAATDQVQHDGLAAGNSDKTKLRSSEWFNNKDNPAMTALYVERYLNYGLTVGELQSDKPIIGIAQTGSDLSPCNRHHQVLAERVREGIREAGGIAFEFPCHPIQETGKRPTASLDRNLAYLSLVEILYGYPLDGVVLLTGCDKTTPALLMAAATVNIPAIVLNVGPMLNGYWENELTGSGTIIWKSRERHARGDIDYQQFMDIVGSSAPSVGHCNTMGTASTMNALAEALGMTLPGSSAIPAPYRERDQMAYRTGLRIVDMVGEDLRPSDILTRQAFENAIVVNAAIGGSTNAPVHLNAIAAHMGVALTLDDWQHVGHKIPLLLNMQPAGQYLGEEYHRAGGLPAILAELKDAGKLHEDAMTVNGSTIGANTTKKSRDRNIIYPYEKPLMADAGFLNLGGTLFDSAIMKTCVISQEFKDRYLSNPTSPNVFEGTCVVFDGPEDYHKSIDTLPEIDEYTILIMRGAGPLGYPGAAEVVNMQPPGRLLKQGITTMPCIGDGRQSGTSGTPSILNASPESAVAGSGLSIVKTGDRIKIDLNTCRVDLLLDQESMARRHEELERAAKPRYPESQTPWQEMFRDGVDQLAQGMVMKRATKYQRIVQKFGTPRDNH